MHSPVISRRLWAAASAALPAGACGSDGGSEAAFEQALELWFERDLGEWVPSRNSSHPASMTLQSALDEPGAHLIAARK